MHLSPSVFADIKDVASPNSVPRIPDKFFATRAHDGVQTTVRPIKDVKGVTTRLVNQATHPTAAAATLHHGIPPKIAAPSSDLPDLPGWVLGILAGGLSFLLIVAVVLYIAQFPPRLEWLQRTQQKWKGRAGYSKLEQDDRSTADEDGVNGGESSAVAPSNLQLRSLKKRSRPTLSIDTGVGVAYDAHGVVAAHDAEDLYEEQHQLEHSGLLQKKRHSYDEEALRMQPKSPIMPAWGSFTAPLPAASTFTGGGSISESGRDIESRPYSLSAGAISTPDLFDFRAYPQQDGAEGEGNDNGDGFAGSAFLRRVNGGIYDAADKLSKAFYDQVTAPEEGLLLPVHEEERERALGEGVFVN